MDGEATAAIVGVGRVNPCGSRTCSTSQATCTHCSSWASVTVEGLRRRAENTSVSHTVAVVDRMSICGCRWRAQCE